MPLCSICMVKFLAIGIRTHREACEIACVVIQAPKHLVRIFLDELATTHRPDAVADWTCRAKVPVSQLMLGGPSFECPGTERTGL